MVDLYKSIQNSNQLEIDHHKPKVVIKFCEIFFTTINMKFKINEENDE